MAEILPSQIDYTSRDFQSLRDDLIARMKVAVPDWEPSDPSDFGLVLVEAFAHLGDVMSYYIDRAANESALSTATRRSSVLALARDLGYTPAGYTSAVTSVTFSNTSASPVVMPAGTLLTAAVEKEDYLLYIPFETDAAVTVGASSAATVSVTQGETVDGTTGYGNSLGVSNGAPRQFFRLPDAKIMTDSVSVYVYDGVNYYPWSQVAHLSDYTPTNRVFRVIDDGYDTYYVEFGDGVSGMIPSSGHVVHATYRKVDGLNGNVAANTVTEITDVPGLNSSQLAVLIGSMTVTNSAGASGGSDPEDINSIRYNASQAYRSNTRAVTLEDYQNLALQVSGCGKASARSTVPTSVLLTVAPQRNAAASEARPGYIYNGSSWVTTTEYESLKASVLEYVDARRLAGVSLTMTDPVYTETVIAVSVTVVPSVLNADAESICKQALVDRFDYSNVGFGASVFTTDVVALLSSLGVTESVSVTVLKRSGQPDGVSNLVAAEDEILLLPEANVTITATGGAG